MRTLRTSGIPRCCMASRTAAPCGSSTAAFGVTKTFIFIDRIIPACALANKFIVALRVSLPAVFCLRATREKPAAAISRRASIPRILPGKQKPDSPNASCRIIDGVMPCTHAPPCFEGRSANGQSSRASFRNLLCKRGERFCVESGSDFAGKQEPLPLVVADEQRAEMFSRARRRRVTADDKFLFVQNLEFDPCAAAPIRFVNGVAQFSDQSFEPDVAALPREVQKPRLRSRRNNEWSRRSSRTVVRARLFVFPALRLISSRSAACSRSKA